MPSPGVAKRVSAGSASAAARRAVDWHIERIGGYGHELTIGSDSFRSLGGTCGSSLWAAGTALIAWLSADSDRLQNLIVGKRILELGAGTGFTGLSLSILGARHVVLTDRQIQLPLLQLNVEANREHLGSAWRSVDVCTFEWGSQWEVEKPWDLLVATDVIYDEDKAEALAASCAELLSSPKEHGSSKRALLSLPDRCDFGYTRGNDPEPLPDYELFLDALDHEMACQGTRLHCEFLDVIPSAQAGTLSSDIVVMLLQQVDDERDQAGHQVDFSDLRHEPMDYDTMP